MQECVLSQQPVHQNKDYIVPIRLCAFQWCPFIVPGRYQHLSEKPISLHAPQMFVVSCFSLA